MFKYITHISIVLCFLFSGSLSAQCVEGDCKNGTGKYIYKDQSSTYFGDFQSGLPHGTGTCEFANGDEYVGEWQHGKFSGKGILHLSDGSQLNGLWSKGQFVGAAKKKIQTTTIPSSDQKIWTLVVGVSDYHHMPVLKYSDDDAYQFNSFLISKTGLALDTDNTRFLINESATRSAIIQELEWLSAKADENDIILFYFTGHGLKGSFLPFDYDGFNNQLFHSDVNRILNQSAAKERICIADACHSGSLMAARGEDMPFSEAFFEEIKSGNLTFLLSSKSSERSLEARGLRMGVFSYFLIKGLGGDADLDQNDKITLGELYSFISKEVGQYTGNQQTPILAGEYNSALILNDLGSKK